LAVADRDKMGATADWRGNMNEENPNCKVQILHTLENAGMPARETRVE
jgi:hypothetical protein